MDAQERLLALFEALQGAALQWGGSLVGRFIVGGGVEMESPAAYACGAVYVGLEPDEQRLRGAVRAGWCAVMVRRFDEMIRLARNAVHQRRPASIGLCVDADEALTTMSRRGVVPNVLLFQPSDRTEELTRMGSLRIDASATTMGGVARWSCCTRKDLETIDLLAQEIFADDERMVRWLRLVRRVRLNEGLERVCPLDAVRAARLEAAVTQACAVGRLTAVPRIINCGAEAPHRLKPAPL